MEKILSLLDRVLKQIKVKEDNHTYTRILKTLLLTPNNSFVVFVENMENNHIFSSMVEVLFESLIILSVIIIFFHQIE